MFNTVAAMAINLARRALYAHRIQAALCRGTERWQRETVDHADYLLALSVTQRLQETWPALAANDPPSPRAG